LLEHRRVPRQVEVDAAAGRALQVEADAASIGGEQDPGRWIVVCAAAAAVLEPALGLPFAIAPMLVATFFLGLTTQGAKIATDTVVQSSVDDGFRGRIFSVYDVLFNVAFVSAAAVAALMLPPDGRSVPLVITVAVVYGVVAGAMARFERQ